MKLLIRNLKVNKRMSQETTCFMANLFVDGELAAFVTNRGQGGPNEYEWNTPGIGAKVAAWAATQKTDFKFDKLDQLLYRPMAIAEVAAKFRLWCSKETLFRLKDDKNMEWRTVKSKFAPNVKKYITDKYGDAVACILNEQDLEVAAEKYV